MLVPGDIGINPMATLESYVDPYFKKGNFDFKFRKIYVVSTSYNLQIC